MGLPSPATIVHSAKGFEPEGQTMKSFKKIMIFCLVTFAATSAANARFL